MKCYIGAKIIKAEPGVAPEGHPNAGQEGYKVVYPDGYESWSPTLTFETAYREVTDQEEDLIVQEYIAEAESGEGG